MEMLRLQHLNAEELRHVETLLKNNEDKFHLPGEQLTATNVLQHKIPTTEDQPIFMPQY